MHDQPSFLGAADRLAPDLGAPRATTTKVIVSGCLAGCSIAALIFAMGNVTTAFAPAAADRGSACHLTKVWSRDASGRVLGFVSPADAAASQAVSEADMGGPMSPAYASLRVARVLVFKPDGSHKRGVFIPAGLQVKVGDEIDFAAGRRDPDLPCHYIPNLIKRVRG